MINFTRAFDSAWERTVIILFRPFSPERWAIIGFNAFLSLLAQGSASFNRGISFNTHQQTNVYRSLPAFLHAAKQWISSLDSLATSVWLGLYIVIGIFLLGFWLVLSWVGCRGEFLFVDNIVRNRAVIVEPWRRYASQANIWFLFHLGLTFLTVVLMILSAGTFIGLDWPWISGERNPQGNETIVVAVLLLILSAVWLLYTALIFVFRSFAIPLMFKQSFSLGAALSAVLQLCITQPISILLYVLASFALAIAGGLLSMVIVCITCCCIIWPAFFPVIGSLLVALILAQLILPILVYYRCFQIDCLSQFGPEYDVWSVDVSGGSTSGLTPIPPPLHG